MGVLTTTLFTGCMKSKGRYFNPDRQDGDRVLDGQKGPVWIIDGNTSGPGWEGSLWAPEVPLYILITDHRRRVGCISYLQSAVELPILLQWPRFAANRCVL